MALVLLVAPSAASSVSASSAASAWLESHKSPTDDQLKELAGANPEAAAIVNALLSNHMKHMRKHDGQSGADIFRSMMTPPHLALSAEGYHASAAVPYASYSAPVVDQAHYNSNAASSRDELAVSRLLSAVASMGGTKGKKISALLKKHEHKEQVENPLMEDQSLFEEATPAPVSIRAIEVAAEVPEEQVTPAPKRENSYLKGIDLSGDMPVATAHRHPHKENSYLKGIDMSGGAADSLASFSFGDSAPAAPAPVVKKVVAPKPKQNNAFLKFLGYVDKAPAPQEKPVAAPQHKEKTNSYLDSVKFFG